MKALRINPSEVQETLSVHGDISTESFFTQLTASTTGTYTLQKPIESYEYHLMRKFVINNSAFVQELAIPEGTDATLQVGRFCNFVWVYDNNESFVGSWHLIGDNFTNIDTILLPSFGVDDPESISTNTTLSLDSYMSELSGNITVTLPDGIMRGYQKLILTQGGANAIVNCALDGFSGFSLGANNKALLCWLDTFYAILDWKGLIKIP